MDYETKKVFLVNVAFLSVTALLCYFAGKFMFDFLLPFLIAVVLSFCANRISSSIKSKIRLGEKFLRLLILILFYLLVILIVALVIWSILKYSGAIFSQVEQYLKSKNNIFYTLSDKIDYLSARFPEQSGFSAAKALNSFLQRGISAAVTAVSSAAVSSASLLPRFILSSAFSVVASFYISYDYKQLVQFLKNVLGDKRFDKLSEIKDILKGSVLRFALGYFILSLLVFFECLIGLSVLSVEHSLLFSAVIAVVDLLPVLGSGTVLLPYAAICFINGNTLRGVGVIVLYICITVIRNFLEPKIIGDRLNVNSLLMLITVFVGLRIGGIGGMILLPVTVAVVIAYYKKQMETERAGEISIKAKAD